MGYPLLVLRLTVWRALPERLVVEAARPAWRTCLPLSCSKAYRPWNHLAGDYKRPYSSSFVR